MQHRLLNRLSVDNVACSLLCAVHWFCICVSRWPQQSLCDDVLNLYPDMQDLQDAVTCVAMSPDGMTVAVGCANKSISLLSTDSDDITHLEVICCWCCRGDVLLML